MSDNDSISSLENDNDEEYSEYQHDVISDTGDFLNELNKDVYVPPDARTPKELAKAQRELETEQKRMVREAQREARLDLANQKRIAKSELAASKKPKKEAVNESEVEVDNDEPLCKDRIVLLKKINQYKALFPSELVKMKVKKNSSIEDLNNLLLECEALAESGSVDVFITDSVYEIIRLCEGLTQGSNYDVGGLTMMLRANPQFNKLIKILYVKYGVFAKIPPETQLILIVITTSFLCIQKNKGKKAIDNYLNEAVVV